MCSYDFDNNFIKNTGKFCKKLEKLQNVFGGQLFGSLVLHKFRLLYSLAGFLVAGAKDMVALPL